MNPIIICEGNDRVGKSTVVNQLANYFGPGAVKHHSSSPPKELVYPKNLHWEIDNYESLMNVFTDISKTNSVIIDRFHLGCPVFGKRYRCYPDSLSVTDLEKYMRFPDNVFLILLTDDPVELMHRDDGCSFEKTPYDFAVTKTEFLKEFKKSKIANKLHIDINENSGFSNTLPSILDFISNKSW